MIAQLRFKIDDYDDYDKEIDDYEDIDANPIQDDKEFEVHDFQYEDPVSESFNNVFIAKSQSLDHVEYANKFKSIVKENKQFSVQMLNLCKTTEEAELFLATALRKKQYFAQAHLDIMVFPRLEVAIMTRHIDFVAHDFCQQILREKLMQSQETGEVLPWNSSNWIDRGLYILGCAMMLPIFIACKVGRDICSCCCSASDTCGSDLENSGNGDPVQRGSTWRVLTFFTFPLNRYIAQSISSVVFLCLLTTMVLDENCTLRPYIIVFTVAHFVTDSNRCFQSIKGNRVRFWDIYSIITDFLLLSGCSLGVAKDYTDERPWMHQLETCMTGIGVTLAITKLFYWCQLSAWLGPLAISIKKVFRDILMVGTAYVVFYLAFSVGIHYIMSVPVPGTTNCTDTETYNRFSVFLTKKSSDGALKTAFWSIFDPGHPEYLGCHYGFARTTALTLWGAYQIVNITILINLLVALMNNTMAQINKDKENQWKFYRTEIWLRFINDTSLCPPFNLLDPLVNLLKWKSEKEIQDRKKEKNVENSKYINLVSRLSRRYLNHIEDSDANDANREDLENTKRELMNNIRRKKMQ